MLVEVTLEPSKPAKGELLTVIVRGSRYLCKRGLVVQFKEVEVSTTLIIYQVAATVSYYTFGKVIITKTKFRMYF